MTCHVIIYTPAFHNYHAVRSRKTRIKFSRSRDAHAEKIRIRDFLAARAKKIGSPHLYESTAKSREIVDHRRELPKARQRGKSTQVYRTRD